MSNQLSIDFNPEITKAYGTCREYIGYLIHKQGKAQKVIAADMDYSPSDLTRKLAQSPNDSRRFTLDDLERFIDATGDVEPVRYLVAKYLARSQLSQIERLQAELDDLRRSKQNA